MAQLKIVIWSSLLVVLGVVAFLAGWFNVAYLGSTGKLLLIALVVAAAAAMRWRLRRFWRTSPIADTMIRGGFTSEMTPDQFVLGGVAILILAFAIGFVANLADSAMFG